MTPTVRSKKELEHITLSPTDTVGDVVHIFATHKPAETGLPAGIVLVSSKEGVLQGIITHGDLNRALAAGTSFAEVVSKIMNPKPFVVVGPLSNQEIIKVVTEKVRNDQLHKTRLEKIIVVDHARKVLNVMSFFDAWQGSDVGNKRVGIVGLGYVGLTLGLTLADLGFTVRAYDTNPDIKKMVRAKKAPFFEDGLMPLLRQFVGNRFTVVDTFEEPQGCEVYFIAVGTPLDAKKVPSLDHLKSAAEHLGKVLKKGDLVVLRSTVPLGTTRTVVTPLLEKHSGLVAGEDFFIAFAPERTIEGKALQELRTLPQVIGGINHASSNTAAAVFNRMTSSTLVVNSLEEAEMVKLINNTYRDVMFGFANEIALVCQKWGIDTNDVIHAANMGYPRSNVPKPSPGVGGYCLEKDPYILMHSAREKGYEPNIALHARNANTDILSALSHDIVVFLKTEAKKKNPKIFILGFAFKGKPATSDMRGSTTTTLVRGLQQQGYTNIYGYDAIVSKEEIKSLGVTSVAKLQDGFKDADVIVVMNNHEALEKLDVLKDVLPSKKPVLFIDTWALYDRATFAQISGVRYRRI